MGDQPLPDLFGSQLLQRCVIVQRDEGGYGLTVSGDNPVFIQSVKDNGSADRSGVQQGDRIIKVNGTLVTQFNHLEVVEMIRSGPYVALTLLGLPPGTNGPPLPSPHSGNGPTKTNTTPNAQNTGRPNITNPQPADGDKSVRRSRSDRRTRRSQDSPSASVDSLTARTIEEEYPMDSDMEADTDTPPWQDLVDKDMVKGLKPKEVKRQEIINELFHTEKTHVRTLKVLNRVFYQPMLRQDDAFPKELTQLLFPNLKELIDLHVSLNDVMKKKRRTSHIIQEIGDMLLKRFDGEGGEEMKQVCATFFQNQKAAMDMLKAKEKKDSRIEKFISDAESNSLCRRLSLSALISSSFPRFAKYPLLIEDLLKYSNSKTEEYKKLEKVKNCSKEILAHVNTAIKECENQQFLLEISKKIDRGPLERSNNEIVKEFKNMDFTTRKLIHHGPLVWRLSETKNIELYTLLLEDVIVLLQKTDYKDKFILKCQKNTHSPIILLNSVLCRPVATNKYAFFLVSTSVAGPQMYELVTSNKSERETWMDLILKAQEVSKKRQTSWRGDRRNARVVVPTAKINEEDEDKLLESPSPGKQKSEEIEALLSDSIRAKLPDDMGTEGLMTFLVTMSTRITPLLREVHEQRLCTRREEYILKAVEIMESKLVALQAQEVSKKRQTSWRGARGNINAGAVVPAAKIDVKQIESPSPGPHSKAPPTPVRLSPVDRQAKTAVSKQKPEEIEALLLDSIRTKLPDDMGTEGMMTFLVTMSTRITPLLREVHEQRSCTRREERILKAVEIMESKLVALQYQYNTAVELVDDQLSSLHRTAASELDNRSPSPGEDSKPPPLTPVRPSPVDRKAKTDEVLHNAEALDVEDINTPLEILSRGPEALEAYQKAIEDGFKHDYRTRLMFVGQERVGKTSLMKNLSGRGFDEREQITDGIDANTFVKVENDDKEESSWKVLEAASTDLSQHVEEQLEDAVCFFMVQELKGKDDQEIGQRVPPDLDVGPILQTLSLADKPDNFNLVVEKNTQVPAESSEEMTEEIAAFSDEMTEEIAAAFSKDMKEEAISSSEEEYVDIEEADDAEQPYSEGLPEPLSKKLQKLLKVSEDDSVVDDDIQLQMWDFGGHDVYYTTHQVFLNHRAIYILVFDLSLDLHKPIKRLTLDEDEPQSRFHELTGLDFLQFWMKSVFAYATRNQLNNNTSRPQLSPPIFVVGTHRESPQISTDPGERKRLVKDKFKVINAMLADKPYEKHIVSRFYSIENSLRDQEDDELSSLRNEIVSLATKEPYMGEKIPLKWLKFEKAIAETIKEGHHSMKLEQVHIMCRQIGIKPETVPTMLQFYHDLGTIVHFGSSKNTDLQDLVILDPQWLINIFKRVITVKPCMQQWPIKKYLWRKLKEEGILDDQLINHVWRDLLPLKKSLLALMEMFDLLVCPQSHTTEEGHDATGAYYVPACLEPCVDEDLCQTLSCSEQDICTLYIDFKDFLPDGFFNRLLVRAARWSQENSDQKPKLYYRCGKFCLGDDHDFQLKMQTTSPVCVKVTIFKTPVESSHDERRYNESTFQPDTVVCASVKECLHNTVDELTRTWIRGIKYEFTIACPCNHSSNQSTPFHLLPLESCLAKDDIRCCHTGKKFGTRFCRAWFHENITATKTRKQEMISNEEIRDAQSTLNLTKMKKVCEYLHLPRNEILDAQLSAGRNDIWGQKGAMLDAWHMKNGHGATKEKLLQALLDCGYRLAYDILNNKWKT